MKKQDRLQSLVDSLKKLNHKKPIKLRAMSSQRKDKNGNIRGTDQPLTYHLYLDHWHDGRRRYQFLKLYLTGDAREDEKSLQIALDIREKKILELRESEAGFSLSDWKKKSDFITYFENMSKTRHHNWSATLRILKEFHPGKLPFGAVDRRFIERFRDHLVSKYSPNTGSVYLTLIKVALNKAVRDEIIDKNPGAQISIAKQETHKAFLTSDEVMRLMDTDCSQKEVKRAFLFACFTGLRLSDIEALRWSDIRDGKLTIRQRKTDDIVVNKLPDPALDILGELRSSGPVFNMPSRTSINNHLEAWTKKAGIDKHIRFHSARHTFAILQLQEGEAELLTVSKLLGHKSLQTTQIYAKITDRMKDKAMDKLSEIFSRKGEK